MLKQVQTLMLAAAVCAISALAQAQVQPCPGFNPVHNVNLACEIATATRTSGQQSSLNGLSPTMATQLSQLPIATAVSGSGLTFSKQLGVFTASSDSLGTILTQRGETIGRHKFLVSFTYQHFNFDTIDGVKLKNMPTVTQVDILDSQGTKVGTSFTQARSWVDLKVHQFTALGTFGITDKLDLTLIVPFSKVMLATTSKITQFNADLAGNVQSFPLPSTPLIGSATGPGDVAVNLKANVLKGERTSVAIAGEFRMPTGDETNYLGTGAYGFKPYVVISRRGRLTANANFGYQWNSKSALFTDARTGKELNLPASLLYSGGVDYRLNRRFTFTGEFLGQLVIDGPRISRGTVAVGQQTLKTITTPPNATYSMNSIGPGFKLNPFKRLSINANCLISLDDTGLRSRIVPLAGVSYRF